MDQPNILFIMSDDHAAHAISAYGSAINRTPHLDRLAAGGMRMDNCHCVNAICTPSRANILTGQHSHINGVRTLADKLDGNRPLLVQKLLRDAGYATAIFGKWHLGDGGPHDPTGFDDYSVLQGQGPYFDPEMIEPGGKRTYTGYTTDIITDLTLNWLDGRDKTKPFFCCCHHKAPHRPWEPAPKYATLFDDRDIPEPETFDDDYANRSLAAAAAKMRIGRDNNPADTKGLPPAGLDEHGVKKWAYQRYIKDYLRCVQSIDDSVGRLLDYLDAEGLAENTIVIYTSDQGFFLGDHGWYDKRFMYEHSLRMPMLVRWPARIAAGSVCDAIYTNIDFAPTWMEAAGLDVPGEMQGVSGLPLWEGRTPDGWQRSLYYRYWMHGSHHNVAAHYGVRTHRHKLIYYYGKACGATGAQDRPVTPLWQPEWELFDLEQDPNEMNNVYHDPAYADVVRELTAELDRLQREAGDVGEH
jgi:arylsulfatase A-like enzyme